MIRWLFVLFLIAGIFSVWMVFSSKHPQLKPASSSILDGYMAEARYTQYDNQGQIHMSIYTPKMTHYAQDSTSYFDQPEVLAYNQQRIPWTIVAKHGKAIHNSEQVDLWGDVKIHQAPQPGYPETTILTAAMTIYPHRGYAETNQPVSITRPDTQIEAVGMQADFKAGIFKLLSSVTGSYEPPQKSNT